MRVALGALFYAVLVRLEVVSESLWYFVRWHGARRFGGFRRQASGSGCCDCNELRTDLGGGRNGERSLAGLFWSLNFEGSLAVIERIL